MKKTTLGALVAAVTAAAFTAIPSQAQSHPTFNAFYCVEPNACGTLASDGAGAVWISTSPYHAALQITKLRDQSTDSADGHDGVYVGGYSYLYPTPWKTIQFSLTFVNGNAVTCEPLIVIRYNGPNGPGLVYGVACNEHYTQTSANTATYTMTPANQDLPAGSYILDQLRIFTNEAPFRYTINWVTVNGAQLIFNSHHPETADCNFPVDFNGCSQGPPT